MNNIHHRNNTAGIVAGHVDEPRTTHGDQNLTDADDPLTFAQGFEAYRKGTWHGDRWKTFRLRFGVYEQRQSGQHMVRTKIPGGRLSAEQAQAIAKANAAHAGGDIHITTRQGLQLYFIDFDALPALVNDLHQGGVSTREASGNTLRAITACPHGGFCPDQQVDAATVANQLTRTWIRHPLVQHMPRKFKTTVSGCAKDCGLGRIDDLAFIAIVNEHGEPGFRVLAGGGLGNRPKQAVELFAFVPEHDAPRVQEAVVRVHNAHSDRVNKNRARLKFLVKQWGADAFRDEVHKAYLALVGLEQPAWQALDWQRYTQRADENAPINIPIEVPLGWLSSSQLAGLADLLVNAGGHELRLTRGQDIVAVGVSSARSSAFRNGVRNLGLDAGGRRHALEDLAVCPGTSTCAIGINDSFALGEHLLDGAGELPDVPGLKIRISGCHNSCAHHHIADIGFHGVAKKINGRPAPHYQLHLGGDANQFGIPGPFIPAKRIKQALGLLLAGYQSTQGRFDGVRAWAEALGPQGIEALLAPALEVRERDGAELAFDIGHDARFVPPVSATGECAAGSVVGEHFADGAHVARFDAQRLAKAARPTRDIKAVLETALDAPAERLLANVERALAQTPEERLSQVRAQWGHDASLMAALNSAIAALDDGDDFADTLAALAAWQQAADREVDRLLAAVQPWMGAP